MNVCDSCGTRIDDASSHDCDAARVLDKNGRVSAAFYRAAAKADTPLNTQVGGDHYKGMAIQPVQFIHANDIGYFEGNVIKYVTRWRKKNGIADLQKARHYIDLLIQLEGGDARKST